jgi:hypothetical protein
VAVPGSSSERFTLMVIWLRRSLIRTAPAGSGVVTPPEGLVTSPPVPQATMNRSSPGELIPAPRGHGTGAPPLRSVSMPIATAAVSSSTTVFRVTR